MLRRIPCAWGRAQKGYARFTPHFMHRRCSYEAGSPECGANCIHKGRYCAVDSIGDAYTDRFEGWQARRELPCPAHIRSEPCMSLPLVLHAQTLLPNSRCTTELAVCAHCKEIIRACGVQECKCLVRSMLPHKRWEQQEMYRG